MTKILLLVALLSVSACGSHADLTSIANKDVDASRISLKGDNGYFSIPRTNVRTVVVTIKAGPAPTDPKTDTTRVYEGAEAAKILAPIALHRPEDGMLYTTIATGRIVIFYGRAHMPMRSFTIGNSRVVEDDEHHEVSYQAALELNAQWLDTAAGHDEPTP